MRNRIHTLTLLALALTSFLTIGCSGDESPMAPTGPAAKKVLVLGDGGTETHVIAKLKQAGFAVTDGGLFYEFTGSGLAGQDAVVLLTGVEYNNDMDDAGEAALVDFVRSGGGLMTTEWMCYSISRTGLHQTIATILPVAYGGSYSSGAETYAVQFDHPIAAGLPQSFATQPDNQFSTLSTKSGALTVIGGSRSGNAVVTWTDNGRVVSWNFAGEYGGGDVWNADIEKLLTNIVAFISHR